MTTAARGGRLDGMVGLASGRMPSPTGRNLGVDAGHPSEDTREQPPVRLNKAVASSAAPPARLRRMRERHGKAFSRLRDLPPPRAMLPVTKSQHA